MKSRLICVSVLVSIGAAAEAQAAPHWGTFQSDSCTALGKRQKSAILWDIPWGASWETTCSNTGATINGIWYSHPDRCVTSANEWGQFDVPDGTCSPNWGAFQNDGCVAVDTRQYSSILWNIPSVVSWDTACHATPAMVADTYFSTPTECVNTGLNEWGRFRVTDTSCRASWSYPPQDKGCNGLGKRRFSAQILNVPPGQTAAAACTTTPAVISSVSFSTPTQCIDAGIGGMWGQFDVTDNACRPQWGATQNNGCTGMNMRQYSAQVLNIPQGATWEGACASLSATVGGQFFSTPTRCVNTGIGGEWGQFDVTDTTCRPRLGTLQADAGYCYDGTHRKYSAQVLDIPPGVSWENGCATTPTDVTTSEGYPAHRVSCVNAITGMFAEFSVTLPDNDTSCMPRWGATQDNGCTDLDTRQYSAQVLNVPQGTTWESACASLSATVGGQFFSTPTRCVNTGIGGEWGEFVVTDTTCRGRLGDLQADKHYCYDEMHRKYSAQVLDIPPGVSWESACEATPTDVEIQDHPNAHRVSCVNAITGMFAEFSVEDDSCRAKWGQFKRDACIDSTTRRVSAVLHNLPEGQRSQWGQICRSTTASICDFPAILPVECEEALSGYWWGHFDVPDPACTPSPEPPPRASPSQHEEMYANIRAKVLARHFAVGRYFRANLLSLKNVLKPVPDDGSWADLDEAARQTLRVWNVENHDRENPLMLTGALFTALAVEHHFGHTSSETVIRKGLDTLRSLYPYYNEDSSDAGWIMRWDPVTSDRWDKRPDGSLLSAQEFLIDPSSTAPDTRYQWVTPSADPRAMAYRADDPLKALLRGLDEPTAENWVADYKYRQAEFAWRYRSWEVSMDELTGLVGAYAMVNGLMATSDVASANRTQALKLGTYLASNGYLLLRPKEGGLDARGATGILPALEYPFERAFHTIQGETGSASFSSRLDVPGALQRLKCASVIEGPAIGYTALAYVGGGIFGPLAGILGPLGGLIGGPQYSGLEAASTTLIPNWPYVAGRGLALLDNYDCFDVSNYAMASEVAIASVLKEVPNPANRFALWMASLGVNKEVCDMSNGYARNFPPHLALVAVAQKAAGGTADPVVKDTYLEAFAAALSDPPLPKPMKDRARRFDSALSTAVAVYLAGADAPAEHEQRLKDQLDERYAYFAENGNDIPIDSDPNGETWQNVEVAIDYMVGLSLAWLHAEDLASLGRVSTVDGFPVPPQHVESWVQPMVPGVVLDRLPEVHNAFLGPDPSGPAPVEGLDVFSSAVHTDKPTVPPPALPDVPSNPTLESNDEFEVSESERDAWTGFYVHHGDEIQITALPNHTIEPAAGYSSVDASGSSDLAENHHWPLPAYLNPVHPTDARKFELLARVGGGWFKVGSSKPRYRYLSHQDDPPRPLYLRINDDVPGNGSGSFKVRVEVWHNH